MADLDAFLSSRFRALIFFLALVYCTLQVVYVSRLPLVMDEFDGAFEAYRLRHEMPYRDFTPYKTVAGYYAETLGTFLSGFDWGRIMAVKMEIVAINTVMLIALALFAARMFRPPSVLIALLLLISCSTFLERSSELRVDMLTAWAGVWSMLLLLDERFTAAGALAGISFLLSQKGAFYVLAGFAAIAVLWLVRREWKPAVRFGAAAAAVLAAYVAFWSALASFREVVEATFVAGARAALVDAYDIRWLYWKQWLVRNPMYAVISAVALWNLWMWRKSAWRVLGTLVYAVAVVVQVVAYSQPWPYFFVLLFPILFVLQAAFFDAARERHPERLSGVGRGWAVAGIVLGVLYPSLRIPVVLRRDNAYQRYNVDVAEALLKPGETYVAGVDIVHDRRQTLPVLTRLSGGPLVDLRGPRRKLMPGIVAALAGNPPKLIMGTYRTYLLPPPFPQFVSANYARVTGSIWLYAPLVRNGRVQLAFSGRYLLDVKGGGGAFVDGRAVSNGAALELEKGEHAVRSEAPVRLRLAPQGMGPLLDPRYREEQIFFPHVYDY